METTERYSNINKCEKKKEERAVIKNKRKIEKER